MLQCRWSVTQWGEPPLPRLAAEPLLKLMNFHRTNLLFFTGLGTYAVQSHQAPQRSDGAVTPAGRMHRRHTKNRSVCTTSVCNTTTHTPLVALSCKASSRSSSFTGNQRRSPRTPAFGAAEGGPGARQHSQRTLAVPFPSHRKANGILTVLLYQL